MYTSECRLRDLRLHCPFFTWQRRCFIYGNRNR